MESLADDLVAADQLELSCRNRFVSTIHQAARRDQFSMAQDVRGCGDSSGIVEPTSTSHGRGRTFRRLPPSPQR